MRKAERWPGLGGEGIDFSKFVHRSTVGPGYCHALCARAQYSIKRDILLSGTDETHC